MSFRGGLGDWRPGGVPPPPRLGSRAVCLGAAVVLSLLSSGSAIALDPQRATTQYVIKTWQRDSGLPSSSVTALVETRDHYLWLGSNAGLTRFDGVRFSDVGSGAIEGGVFALAEGPDGALWVATQAGQLARLRNGQISLQAGPCPGFYITALLVTRDGTLWIASLGAGIYRLQGGRYQQELPGSFTEIMAMVEDPDGTLWVGGRGTGLLHRGAGGWTRLTAREGLAGETIHALHFDDKGALWIGTSAGLSCLSAGRLKTYRQADGLAHESVTALLSDQDGNLWIGTQAGGLQRYHEGRFATLTQQDGLAGDAVRVLVQDHERSLWVGTSNGLNRLNDGRFITYGRPEGLVDPTVHTVVQGRKGDVWVGTGAAGAYRIRAGQVVRLEALRDSNVMAMHEAQDGSLWLATGDSRLFRIRHGSVTEETPRTTTGFVPKISSITELDGELLLAGSTLGLGRLRNRRFVPLHASAPRIHFIFTIYHDGAGTLWLGSSQGLVRVKGGEYRFFTTRDGLADDRVRSIAGEADGTLWLATMGGLCRFRDGEIRKLTRRDGLPDTLLRAVLDDGRRSLWLSSIGHIFRLSKRQLAEFFAGKRDRVTPYEYSTSDGLRTSEVPMSAYPAIRAADGLLWFATARGVSVIDPGLWPSLTPPPVRIEQLSVDDVAETRASYPPGRGRVEVQYTALSFRAPERLRFRYKLVGFDEEWVDAGERRTAQYTNLPPGRYTFNVAAAYGDGPWNEQGSSSTFTLRPHWYQTVYVRLLAVLAVGLIVWGGFRLRLYEMHQRYSAVLHERNRLAREMHDTLAQNLGGVAFQLDAIKMQHKGIDPELRQELDQTTKMIRFSLSEAYRAIRDLRAQALKSHDLASALEEVVQRISAEQNLAVELHVEGVAQPLSAVTENNLLRIAQEAVANAAHHAAATRVDVELSYTKETLTIRVRDDGRGFDMAKAFSVGDGHYGLLGMRERAEWIGGHLTLTSRRPGGTDILVTLPMNAKLRKDRAGL
jgi:signal transduction histidine kinase/ligand-binding sensor domain-containing protein